MLEAITEDHELARNALAHAASTGHAMEQWQRSTSGMLVTRCYDCSGLLYITASGTVSGTVLMLQCRHDLPSIRAPQRTSNAPNATNALQHTATLASTAHATSLTLAAFVKPCAYCGNNTSLTGRSCAHCASGSAASTERQVSKSKRRQRANRLRTESAPQAHERYLIPASIRISNDLQAQYNLASSLYDAATLEHGAYVAPCGTACAWRVLYLPANSDYNLEAIRLAVLAYPCHLQDNACIVPYSLTR
jgi:hypothetical protein